MPSKCACGCKWLVRAKGHFYGDHATNPPAANTFLAQAQAADRRYNGDENPNYGKAKANAKVQERARVDAEERIAKMPKSEPMLTEAEAAAKAAQIMESEYVDDQMNTRGRSLEKWLGIVGRVPPESGEPSAPRAQWAFYFGYTGRTLPDEAMRWLTKRGASEQLEDGSYVDLKKRNRPTLLWADGSTISMMEAHTHAGFFFFEVYSSTLMINARYVEKALQERYQYLPVCRPDAF